MAKVRVYELAKKMGVPANQLLKELQDLGVDVKSNLSALDESVLHKLRGDHPPPPPKLAPHEKVQPAGVAGAVKGVKKTAQAPASEEVKEAPAQAPQAKPHGVRPEKTPPGRHGHMVRPQHQATPAPAPVPVPPRPPAGRAPEPARQTPKMAPAPEVRRKTKRERRIEKFQAKEDRRQKLQHELEQAKANAESGEAVFIREGITVKELAEKLNVKIRDIISKLMMRNIMATINQPLDAEVAVQVCGQFGFSAEIISYEDEMVLSQVEAPEEEKTGRSPVVTVMGHVDHGKSSLLEAIHDLDITSKEFGGITQHIGAYKVSRGNREYVFLDTPGHEAFTLMRARGAQVTDIVILVVAADDGVMPQTVEAINHCKAAEVPIIVAINKMDKPGANPDKVKQELSQHGILTEDWGGDVVSVQVSAKTKHGIEDLLEMVSLVADMLHLKGATNQLAIGTILESKLDRARGPVATVLVQDGTVKVGDLFLCGSTFGRVRGIFDDKGRKLEGAGPSTRVEILGFSQVHSVVALFQGMDDESKARQVASFRREQEKQKSMRTSKVRLDNVFGAIQQGELEELALILKTDVHGSLEAVAQQIQGLPKDQVRISIVHQGVGAISESDILLASASNALVIGFNVRADRKAMELAKSESVEILLFTVIYDLVDQLKQALTGMLKPIEREVVLGHAEVKEVFKISKVGTIAGCIATDGRLLRNGRVRVLRDNVVVYTGKLSSLKRFKDDVGEVKEGSECGIGIENFGDLKPADVLEVFEIKMEDRKL